jgi:hypothetical protein
MTATTVMAVVVMNGKCVLVTTLPLLLLFTLLSAMHPWHRWSAGPLAPVPQLVARSASPRRPGLCMAFAAARSALVHRTQPRLGPSRQRAICFL